MKMISTPRRLRVGAILLLGVAPLAALHLVLEQRAPWWRLPVQEMAFAGAGALIFTLPFVFWIQQARKWAVKAAMILAVLWCLWNGFDAIHRRSPALGFFTVLLISYFISLLSWIRYEMGRSYLDPDAEWYQGLPDPIPELVCEIGKQRCRVSRFDLDGAFVFCDRASRETLPEFEKSATVELSFIFRDRQLRCIGQPIRVLDGNRGAGFRFVGLTPDMKKELGDYVEKLRGQGYVD